MHRSHTTLAHLFGIMYSFSCHLCTDPSPPSLVIFYRCKLVHVVQFNELHLYRCSLQFSVLHLYRDTLLMLLSCFGFWICRSCTVCTVWSAVYVQIPLYLRIVYSLQYCAFSALASDAKARAHIAQLNMKSIYINRKNKYIRKRNILQSNMS